MNILSRLEQWKEQGVLSSEQHSFLAGLSRGEPLSVFLELNMLLYAGILAFAAGLAWTVSTWSQQLGAALVVALLSAMFAGCVWYCFSRAPGWAPNEIASSNMAVDYVLYLGSLIWSVELAYIEQRFHLLSGQWDSYLLATSGLFFFLAYRFDNRLVLSLALSALAGWFGLTVSHWPSHHQDAVYRQSAISYGLAVGGSGVFLRQRGLKPHFFGTYLNVAANVLFWALLSGVFERNYFWLAGLLAACVASLVRGLKQREFSFVAYAAVYGYIGVSVILIRELGDFVAVLYYFLFTGAAMLVTLVQIARRIGREA